MSSSPTPFDDLWAKLGARMLVVHESGTEADAAHTQEDRVIWIRAGALGSEPCPYQLDTTKVLARRVHPWKVSIYGVTDADVCTRVDALEAAIDFTIGPPQGLDDVRTGYKFTAGQVEPRGNDLAAAGYGCNVSVTLYTITLSETRSGVSGAAHLAAVPLSPTGLAATPIAIP